MEIRVTAAPLATRLSPAPDTSYRDTRSRTSDIAQMEESGTFWLWAWPEILGWPVGITWLFSPISGNYPWPGDLWGVDAAGELLIVETKSSANPADPFEDFLKCEQRRSEGQFPPTVQSIQTRWEKGLRDERRFIDVNRDALQFGSDRCIPGPGVLPNSCKRLVTWRWRGLYLEFIAPVIASQAYEDAAVSALNRLNNRSELCPHYFGLFTILGSARPCFSAAGKQRYEALRASVDADHVHVRTIKCTGSVSPEHVEIVCAHPSLDA